MTITDEAVEAVADIYAESEDTGSLETARAALEAAAPRMRRTIATVEELDALPVGSVVLDRLDICYRLYHDPAYREPVWCVVGETSPSSPHAWLPATVLHEGPAK
jgi:hypothetical protein